MAEKDNRSVEERLADPVVYKHEVKNGNTRVIIHSNLMRLTTEEREQWYADEMKKGNPKLLRIAEIVRDCYRNSKT